MPRETTPAWVRLGTWVLLIAGILGLVRILGETSAPLRPPASAGEAPWGANLLPNPDFDPKPEGPSGLDGWTYTAGVTLGDWTFRPGGRSVRLQGVAARLESPPLFARPGSRWRGAVLALTDDARPARLRLTLRWLDRRGEEVGRSVGPWRWVPARDWAWVEAVGTAPQGTVSVVMAVEPAADRPLYLDGAYLGTAGVYVSPFADYGRAAFAFTFDWETAMGGLIHSRADDAYDPRNAVDRGLRMRQGADRLLELFQRYGIRGTFYAAGYALLDGTADGSDFGDPVYPWATQANGWESDYWETHGWFSVDPHGTWETDPAWYFGDQARRLAAAGQEIQTHTFGHIYLGLAAPEEVARDLELWNAAAARLGLPPATGLAFPWTASLGVPDATWDLLEAAGIDHVTRVYWGAGRPQYHLLPDPYTLGAVPAHPELWIYPDRYFPGTDLPLEEAQGYIDAVRARAGYGSLWTHTEEVAFPEQVDAWDRLLAYATGREDLWIAPVGEIVAHRRGVEALTVDQTWTGEGRVRLRLVNGTDRTLRGLTLVFPAPVRSVRIDGAVHDDVRGNRVRVPSLPPGLPLELEVEL